MTITLGPLNDSSKHGVVNLSNGTDVVTTRARWTYTYSMNPGLITGVECVPMCQFPARDHDTMGGNSTWLLGYNEPDMPGADYSDPAADATLTSWKYLSDTYSSKSLVSPAPLSDVTYDVTNWLVDFRAAYFAKYAAYPRFNALAAHIYFGSASTPKATIQQAIALASSWCTGTPQVWVTEWGMPWNALSTTSKATMNEFYNWMKSQSMITHYSWFGTYINVGPPPPPWYPPTWLDLSLVDAGGVLTAWGVEYTRS